MTPKQFAEHLGLPLSTVARWVRKGGLAFWRVPGGRRLLIPVSELERHVQQGDGEVHNE